MTDYERKKDPNPPKVVEVTKHLDATRKNIPTAEYQSVMGEEDAKPIRVAYERRNRDLDPQLVWRGKDEQDWSDLVVHAPPIYIQEKVHPKALIEDLIRQSKSGFKPDPAQPDLFGDFNGIPEGADKTDFYQHDGKWQNRMILGDSLQVMASLAEREGLRGQVQCIYFDPPYGIKFNSNFQWSTNNRDVKDGRADNITREPEMVKAFRDTWRDGINSYLTYMRERLTVARDLLNDSGSIFVQIGDENVHLLRALLDEIFGSDNHISQIAYRTTTGRAGEFLSAASNYLLWYGKSRSHCKFRAYYQDKQFGTSTDQVYTILRSPEGVNSRMTPAQRRDGSLVPDGSRIFRSDNLTSQSGGLTTSFDYLTRNKQFVAPLKGGWKTNIAGMRRLDKADRLWPTLQGTLQYARFLDDFPVIPLSNIWTDTGTGSFTDEKIYVVQTGSKIVERCVLMATDPGDLVLDPTCGSGTTAFVAEQWGRRWITIDTSRVALALARARIMGARYPFYLLADSKEGQLKEAEVTGTAPSTKLTFGNVRHGFVYERVPHITLKSIANNSEIDVIWEKFQAILEPIRGQLNKQLKKSWEEWEIPRTADPKWNAEATAQHAKWWEQRIARQKEIDASIAAKAEYEYLYDKPYPDPKKVRVAGPFTVESLSPHRTLSLDENDELLDPLAAPSRKGESSEREGFVEMILENLKTSGVQQAHREDKIAFTSLVPWPGHYICAEGVYEEQGEPRRAGVFIGPEFGTVSRPDLVEAAREAGDAAFDVLIACAFNYDAHSSEFERLGRIPILKARMNADLHMADDLKNTGKGNLFVIFGEPDIDILSAGDLLQVKINGVDVFDPRSGEVRSDGPDGIACWFIDTDYNGESFFVRHAYFLGANDPYKALKTTLKAEIDEDAWSTLNQSTSRPFPKPSSRRIAVKVINHLGDEVMKVFRV